VCLFFSTVKSLEKLTSLTINFTKADFTFKKVEKNYESLFYFDFSHLLDLNYFSLNLGVPSLNETDLIYIFASVALLKCSKFELYLCQSLNEKLLNMLTSSLLKLDKLHTLSLSLNGCISKNPHVLITSLLTNIKELRKL